MKQLEDLRRKAGWISDTLFVLRLSQIAALADNGHTGVIYRGEDNEGRHLGLRLASFGADFAVVYAEGSHADLLGARLAAIDGTPISRLRQVARTLAEGVSSRRDQMGSGLLESLDQLNALGLTRSAEQATYRFVSRDGTTRGDVLTVVPRGARAGGCSLLEPDAAPESWKNLLASDKAPWALQEPDENMRTRDRPDLDALVIQQRVNMDAGRSIIVPADKSEAALYTGLVNSSFDPGREVPEQRFIPRPDLRSPGCGAFAWRHQDGVRCVVRKHPLHSLASAIPDRVQRNPGTRIWNKKGRVLTSVRFPGSFLESPDRYGSHGAWRRS